MKTINLVINLLKDLLPEDKYKRMKQSLDSDCLTLLEAIEKKQMNTDTEAAQQAFSIKSNSTLFQKNKKKLSNVLFENIVFIQPSKKGLPNSYDEFTHSNLYEAIVKNCNFLNKREIAIKIENDIFKFAYKYYLHSTVISFCQTYINYYGKTEVNSKLFNYYTDIYEKTISDLHIESLSEIYYNKINHHFVKNINVNKTEVLKECDKYITELAAHENKVRSRKFHSNFYDLVIIKFELQKNFEEILKICDKNIEHILSLPYKSYDQLKFGYRKKTVYLIQAGQYDEAIDNIEKQLAFETSGSPLWFNIQYNYALVLILKKDYIKLQDVINTAIEHKSFKNVKAISKGFISIINVYIYLFKLLDVLPKEMDEKSEVKKYLKEYNHLSKDKSGFNIPIMVAELIEAILQRNDNYIIDRMDALGKYSSRYVTKNTNLRSNCFIKMLVVVVKNNYHPVAIERHAIKYLKKLKENPKHTTDEAGEIEIIPYEDLWDILISFIKSKKKIFTK